MRTQGKNSGFTLVELMIAMGIMAIGVALIATAFPSALIENKQSVDDTMATLLSENALAIIRTKLTHTALAADASFDSTNPAFVGTPYLSTGDMTYAPLGTSTRFGWVAFAQRAVSGQNDYRIAILPFRLFQSADTLDSSTKVTFNTDDTVNSYQVILKNGAVNYPQSAALGCYVTRTALRP